MRPIATACIFFAGALALPGCPKKALVQWETQVALAPVSGQIMLQQVANLGDPFTTRDYVTLEFHRIFVRDLPGMRENDTVVIGLRAKGVLKGRDVETVWGPRKLTTGAVLDLQTVASIGPFPFRGKDVELELTVERVPPAEVAATEGRLGAAGPGLLRIVPHDAKSIAAGADEYARTFNPFRVPPPRWSEAFVLSAQKPANQTAAQLLDGEVILVWRPLATAPGSVQKKVTVDALTGELEPGVNGGLREKKDKSPFRSAPYVVLRAKRSARLGWAMHPAYDALTLARSVLREGKLDEARSRIAAATLTGKAGDLLSEAELALVAKLLTIVQGAIDAEESAKKGDAAAAQQKEKLLHLVREVLSAHGAILTADEKSWLEAEEKRLAAK